MRRARGAARRRSRRCGCGAAASPLAPLLLPPLPTAHPDATFMTVFGEDPVVAGLCALSGARLRPPALSAHDILNSGAERTAAVIELFRTDQAAAGDPDGSAAAPG